jgi:hypothetical protein
LRSDPACAQAGTGKGSFFVVARDGEFAVGDSISASGLAAIALMFGGIALALAIGIALRREKGSRRRSGRSHRIDLFDRDAGDGPA